MRHKKHQQQPPERLYRNIKEVLALAFAEAHDNESNVYIYESATDANSYFFSHSSWHSSGTKLGVVYFAKINRRTGGRESFALLSGIRIERDMPIEEHVAAAMHIKNVEKTIRARWPWLINTP